MQNLKIRHSATNERNNLKSGHNELNLKIFYSAKYHLYHLWIAATMLFRNYFDNYYNKIIITYSPWNVYSITYNVDFGYA